MSLLGIDIGSTGCKAVAFSLSGRCLAQAYREYNMLHPQPGWAELDSKTVWQAAQEVIAQVALESAQDPITALSISSIGESVVPVTKNREILGTSIHCSDNRGSEYATQLQSKISQEQFFQINPNIIGVNYTMPKLRWICDHQSDIYQQADYFLSWADLTAFLLGGQPVASPSLACRSLLFDLRANQWSDKLISLSQLESVRSKLAPICPCGSVIGTVDKKLAERLNLPAEVAIVVGAHDQACNVLGAGILDDRQTVYGIGTFICITPTFTAVPELKTMLKAGLCIEPHLFSNQYLSFLYNQGGAIVKWFRDTFVATANSKNDDDAYERLAEEMPDEPTDIFVTPYFEPTGPPDYLTNTTGTILGLRTSTTRGEIFRAVMESATYYFADVLASNNYPIRPREFVATGGGAKSDAWLQIKADIFGIPFVRNEITECSALGAALLAGIGSGQLESNRSTIERFAVAQRRFEPQPERHQLYQERLGTYRKAVAAVRDYQEL
ncbi:MAG: hypothetical protein JW936_04805 [Sedimentisphaerales bacterium]|nr:hypothetical protein [Sedimentisphaerales bacterium]